MSTAGSVEKSLIFTGERVVPDAVEPQLWNEHISRYYFARLFASQRKTLDVGCGTGYGTNLLAELAESAVGFDSSKDAIEYGVTRYHRCRFLIGSADAYPFRSRSFDLITAFEVIEHIEGWPTFIEEAARVLKSDGVFLVSTPNRLYYAETREGAGPNPFHVHEFAYEEFEQSLLRQFAYVTILAQNQSESIIFAGVHESAGAVAHIPALSSPSSAHFFIAVCSQHPVEIPKFSFVSDSGNLLRERERHIHLLEEDVRETHEQHLRLLGFHDELHRVLAERTTWAANLEAELDVARKQTQNAVETANETISFLAAKNGINPNNRDDELRAAEARLRQLETELSLIRGSRWLRLGRNLHLGPYNARRFRPQASLRRKVGRLKAFWKPRIQRWSVLVQECSLSLAAFFSLAFIAVALLCLDFCFAVFGRRRRPRETAASEGPASIIIPNWNGRDLLEKFLPSVIASAALCPATEVIVVDNASSDGSVTLLRAKFPSVRVVSMPTNVGFSKAANVGVEASSNQIVVLLNNDMRVEPAFLKELLAPFSDPLVFAASAQIFFTDHKKRREETGLTEVWWSEGRLRVGHRADAQITRPFPCAYPGGGSSAYDRRKFLELGGFDSLFNPFYYEDTDLGRMAWARGWKVLYVPSSVAHHEHRGTIGKNFSPGFVSSVVRQNSLLYCWKNLADWRALAANFGVGFASLLKSKEAPSLDALLTGKDARELVRRLLPLLRSRWKAKTLRLLSDRESFRRPLGGYYRDRFLTIHDRPPERLNVLFAAPYPISPPVHGGAVFMREALLGLTRHVNVHLISFVDTEEQLPAQEELREICSTAVFMVRPHVSLEDQWTLAPNAVREFSVRDFAWAIHRIMFQQKIDVVQLEYTILGQYGEDYRHIPSMLFEHDISVQSLRRRLAIEGRDSNLLLEYLRMRLYEPRLLKRFTRVQVCSDSNRESLLKLSRAVSGKVDSDVRAGIDVMNYPFTLDDRESDTLLFIGSFRHSPNVDAIQWFISEVFPSVLGSRPATALYIVGSTPPESVTWLQQPNIHLLGAVPDVKVALGKYAIFICPIRSGSGVRVKLLEAFASGIPAVSTRVGAEGLAGDSSQVCEQADSPADFASAVIHLLSNKSYRTDLATRARRRVEERWDSRAAVDRLVATYRDAIKHVRTT